MTVKAINGLDRTENKSKIEKIEKGLRKQKERYGDVVIRMYKEYESLIFALADKSSNQTIESMRIMTIGERMSFQENLTEKIKAQNEQRRSNKGSGEESGGNRA